VAGLAKGRQTSSLAEVVAPLARVAQDARGGPLHSKTEPPRNLPFALPYPGQMIHLQNLGLPGPKSFRAEYWRPTWSGAHADECNARASTRAFQRCPGLPLSVR